jgi:hypothetical protein
MDPRFDQILVQVQQLRQNADLCAPALPHKFDYLVVELLGGHVLVAVGCGEEFETLLLQLYHYLSHRALGQRVCFGLLHCHELSLQHLKLIIDVHPV